MSKEIALPSKILDELKCNFCHEYLSCFPVYAYTDDNVVACGRCPLLHDDNPAREIAYEKVAQSIIFPCKYKVHGCLEEFIPVHLLEHEQSCNFRQYFCPLIPLGTCNWQGPIEELLDHYIQQHNCLVLNNCEFKFDVINRDSCNYIIKNDNQIFILHVMGNKLDENIYMSLRLVGRKKVAKQYAYQLSLYRLDMEEDLAYCRDDIQCDNEMNINKRKAIAIHLQDINNKFSKPLFVICKVSITQKTQSSNAGGEVVDEHYNENIIKTIECPVCFTPMVPPIYQCVAGHSICEACKSQVNDCPTCHAGIQNTRNFMLEEMTSHFKYPCKYRDYDCKYVSTAQDIKKHEAECNFGPYTCPLSEFEGCNWKNKLELLLSHIKVTHEDNLVEVDTITAFVGEDEEDCFMIHRFKQLFILICSLETEFLHLSMQFVGPKNEASNYVYEIDFINHESNERNYFKRTCSQFRGKELAFQNYLKIPYYMIESFVKKEMLTIKYRIFRLLD